MSNNKKAVPRTKERETYKNKKFKEYKKPFHFKDKKTE